MEKTRNILTAPVRHILHHTNQIEDIGMYLYYAFTDKTEWEAVKLLCRPKTQLV